MTTSFIGLCLQLYRAYRHKAAKTCWQFNITQQVQSSMHIYPFELSKQHHTYTNMEKRGWLIDYTVYMVGQYKTIAHFRYDHRRYRYHVRIEHSRKHKYGFWKADTQVWIQERTQLTLKKAQVWTHKYDFWKATHKVWFLEAGQCTGYFIIAELTWILRDPPIVDNLQHCSHRESRSGVEVQF